MTCSLCCGAGWMARRIVQQGNYAGRWVAIAPDVVPTVGLSVEVERCLACGGTGTDSDAPAILDWASEGDAA